MIDYCLPKDYAARSTANNFADAPFVATEMVAQPEVFEAADYLLRMSSRSTIIDIGCGGARKFRSVNYGGHYVGINFARQIGACRANYEPWGEWYEADLGQRACIDLASLASEQSVVVCANVLERLLDPAPLVELLAACYARGAIVITSTPDRIRVRGADHKGPPPGAFRVREWALDEYEKFLANSGLPAIFCGYTFGNSQDAELNTGVTIHDIQVAQASALTDPQNRPLAILGIYNEADVIEEVVQDLINQGCDVFVLDNWSDDGCWELLSRLVSLHPSAIRIERFPKDGPTDDFEWAKMLQRKEEIAVEHPNRWIIHSDGDEIRRSPFVGKSLAESLEIAARLGANRINFTVLDFRPVDQGDYRPSTLTNAFKHFEFGMRPGHFVQHKAWLQGDARIDLASSGGHVAQFEGAIDFRYKFLLQHYPVRSENHGRRKILQERAKRWAYEKTKLGWHTHYDSYTASSKFHWDKGALTAVDETFWQDHGLVIMTDLLQRRLRSQEVANHGTTDAAIELLAERERLRELNEEQRLRLEHLTDQTARMQAEIKAIHSSTTWRLLDFAKQLELRSPTTMAIARRLVQKARSAYRKINLRR